MFKTNGYEIIYPEEYSLTQLINIINSSSCCTMGSGTVAHNMLFAPYGQKTIILERFAVVNNDQIDIDRIRNLDVTYVDAHYTIYPITMGGGPCLFAPTSQLQNFCKDNGYELTLDFFDQGNLRNAINWYMKVYEREYGYAWGLEGEWMLDYSSLLYEAYLDSVEVFGEYLSGRKLYSKQQLLSLHGLRNVAKGMLNKLH